MTDSRRLEGRRRLDSRRAFALWAVLVACAPLAPFRPADAGGSSGGGGASGGNGGVGGGFGTGGGAVGGGTARDAGWPVVVRDAGSLRLVELVAPAARDVSLVTLGEDLFAYDGTGALWRLVGSQWVRVNDGIVAPIAAESFAGGLIFYDVLSRRTRCDPSCLDGGAGVIERLPVSASQVCRGEPKRYLSNLGGVYELRDGGWLPVAGGFSNIDAVLSGCLSTTSGDLFIGGTRIRVMELDGGFRVVLPQQEATNWSSFSETGGAVWAVGGTQQLARALDGGFVIVADRGGLSGDAWFTSFGRPDGTIAIVGAAAFTVVRSGQLESTPWPMGALNVHGSAMAADGTVWVSAVSSSARVIVGVRP